MKCILMNFDDRIRVIPNIEGKNVGVPIGEMKDVDVPEGIYSFIKKSMEKTGDPLVILAEAIEKPPELIELMDILAHINSMPYEDALRRTARLVGQDNVDGPRPSLAELRNVLRHVALKLAAGVKPSPEVIEAIAADHKKTEAAKVEAIRVAATATDDQDAEDAKLAEARAKNGTPPTARELSQRQQADIELGIIGGTAEELSAALNQPPADPDAFNPRTAPKEPAKKSRVQHRSASKQGKKAAKAKPAQTRRAGSASKLSKRIKA